MYTENFFVKALNCVLSFYRPQVCSLLGYCEHKSLENIKIDLKFNLIGYFFRLKVSTEAWTE